MAVEKMNENESRKKLAEESRTWEKERFEKERIKLKKQYAEKRALLKNKLKWLDKEPRAAFFYFFYLALYFEKIKSEWSIPKAESYVDPFSVKALGTDEFNLTMSKTSGHQGAGVASLGVMTSDFNFEAPEKKTEPEKSEPQDESILSDSTAQDNLDETLDKILGQPATSTLKNRPANGVFFPSFVANAKGVENITGCITEIFLDLDMRIILGLTKKINDAWSKVYADFSDPFFWMDIKNEEQCVWAWGTLKNKGVSPPLNPLNNYQRWHFICATFDLWNGWTNAQLEELKKNRKKVSQQFLELNESPHAPQKHKKVLIKELEKAWDQQLRRKKSKTSINAMKLPAKSKKQLVKLSSIYGVSEMEVMVNLIDYEYAEIIKNDKN